MTTQRKRQQTPEQKQRFDAFLEMARQLEGEVSQGKPSEQTQRLAAHAQAQEGLQRYSERNQLLILRQRPGATEVGTFKTWREQGKRVKCGEHPIFIRAPRKNQDGEEGAGFRTTMVFDQDQVEPIEEGETTQANEE